MNTDKFLTASLLRLVQLATGGNLMRHILDLVSAEFASADSGVDKKARVTAAVHSLEGDLGLIARGMGSWMVSIAIDVAHAYLVTHTADV